MMWTTTGLPVARCVVLRRAAHSFQGEFRATKLARTLYSNGTSIVQESCDLGLVEGDGFIRYVTGINNACPGENALQNASMATVLPAEKFPLVPPPDYGNLTCDQDSSVKGMDTSDGPGLNLTNPTIGVSNRDSSIPPPESMIVPAPPVFSVPGGLDAIHGVWRSPAKGILRMNAVDGFSALLYSNASDEFFLYLSRYNSHDCNGGGQYWVSVSETVSYENETLYIKPGCGIIFFNSTSMANGSVDPYGIASVVNRGFGCNETYPESSWIVTERIKGDFPEIPNPGNVESPSCSFANEIDNAAASGERAVMYARVGVISWLFACIFL